MSIEHQVPVLIKKTQMSGDRGSQCGLTSLLPMSCRGRAAAFARDLHSRLRNLGAAQEDSENSWLARDNTRPNNAAPHDLDTFYDFELECESPSSPADEYPPFTEQVENEDQEPPFYDVSSDPEVNEQPKSKPDKNQNGFKFTTAFFTDSSPVKQQPVSRENGHIEKKLFSPITFEGCARQNSTDEVDCAIKPSNSGLFKLPVSSTQDSDSEFESAKSDPSEGVDEVFESEKCVENGLDDRLETVSLNEIENVLEEELPNGVCEDLETKDSTEVTTTSECTTTKELSPVTEKETSPGISDSKSDSDEAEDDRPQRVRRCSSLKTGKTPPGTPGRKKIVRFADVLGLDLADVKTFMDEIPVIPKSAYDDLTGCDVQNSPPVSRAPLRLGALTLVPLFQIHRDITEKLEIQNVCLESARVCDGVHVTVCGSVRVRNLDFHKTVHIRYTMNRWKTYTDLQTTYVPGSCDGFSDRFQFVLYVPCITSGQRLEIAVRFQCKGQQFWDSNSGANYCFDCLALGATVPVPTSQSPLHPTVDWHPSFY